MFDSVDLPDGDYEFEIGDPMDDFNLSEQEIEVFDEFDLNELSGDLPWDEDGNLNPEIISIGDPDGSGFSSQTTPFTCAVVSQQMVLNEFGFDVSESQLVYDATANGWLTDGGTSPADAGNLLEYYGVPTHHSNGLDNMISDLAEGHQVIVGLDSDEIWHSDNWIVNDLRDMFGDQADHAVVVKGIKTNETGEPIVVINDPGYPEGAGKEYPLDQFMDAWQDGNCHYVATDIAPPDWEDAGLSSLLADQGYLESDLAQNDAAIGEDTYVPDLDTPIFVNSNGEPSQFSPLTQDDLNPSFSDMLDNLPFDKKCEIISNM